MYQSILKHQAVLKRVTSVCAVSLLAASPFAMLGCNTTEGFGEDVEATGDAIEDAAEDASS